MKASIIEFQHGSSVQPGNSSATSLTWPEPLDMLPDPEGCQQWGVGTTLQDNDEG